MVSFFVPPMPTPPNIEAPSTQVKVANDYCEHEDYEEYFHAKHSTIMCRICHKTWKDDHEDDEDYAKIAGKISHLYVLA
jgi:predicted metal-binding protein